MANTGSHKNPRTGLSKVRTLARGLCGAVAVATPAIRRIYGSNAALMASLEAANAACALLVEEVDGITVAGD